MIAVARCCAWCLLARFMCTLAVAPPCGPVDCNDINRCWGRRTSQVVAPNPLTLRCNHWTDGGGWTILQQRRSRYVDFYRTCAEYKRGFGTWDTFWLGLDNLYRLTKNHESQLRVEVTFGRFGTVWYAEYDGVTFGNETAFYALNYSSYNGRGGLEDGLRNHSGHFCCSDSPAGDRCRRLAMYGRTAWWFGEGRPFSSDLNAVLNGNFQRQSVYWIGVSDISFTRIMFRPSRFRRVTCDKSCPNGIAIAVARRVDQRVLHHYQLRRVRRRDVRQRDRFLRAQLLRLQRERSAERRPPRQSRLVLLQGLTERSL